MEGQNAKPLTLEAIAELEKQELRSCVKCIEVDDRVYTLRTGTHGEPLCWRHGGRNALMDEEEGEV